MDHDIPAVRLPWNRDITPRQAISIDSDFTIDLPIRGGWGYGLDDAVVIERIDPSLPKCQPWNAFEVQRRVAEYRLEFELHQVYPDGCADLLYTFTMQRLVQAGGRYFDVITYEVTLEPWASPGLDPSIMAPVLSGETFRYTAEITFDVRLLFKDARYRELECDEMERTGGV